MTASIDISLGEVAASLALVAIAVAVSLWRRADLDRDIGLAVVRSALQLTAVGYVINAIFEADELGWVLLLISGMVLFGAFTARARARRVPGAFWPLLAALAVAGADPTDAVRLQLILLWSLLGSVALAGLVATSLASRNFFTAAHQLREPPEP